MEAKEETNKSHSHKDIILFIINLIMISVISYVYVEGLLKFSMFSPEVSPIIVAIIGCCNIYRNKKMTPLFNIGIIFNNVLLTIHDNGI